ncbi:Zinc finger MYM-type protein 1 [Linum perenne]
MKRYYSAIRSSTSDLPIAQEVESQSSASEQCLSHPPSPTRISQPSPTLKNQHKQQCESSLPPKGDVDVNSLKADPGLRKKISSFHPNVQDEVRRVYIQRGPCQPKGHSFPFREIGGKKRRFIASWFDDYWWLEYSIEKDAAYCLPCYLFKHEESKKGAGDSFVSEGFTCWNKKNRLDVHSDEAKKDYRTRLEASLNFIKFLLHNGLPFLGHDESLEFHARGRDSIQRVVLDNAPQNQRMTSPDIQKDIVHAIASEITKAIIKDLENDFFCILVDEARDVSIKEQMAIVLRFTKALTLKNEIEAMLVKNGLSLSRIRGQGYDGASNMKGEINGLKSLILAENPSAHYVHCFAHQLQLTLVAVAKNHYELINVVGSSCKRQDSIKEHQAAKGRGLNQEMSLKRPCETRWGSHFETLVNLASIFSSVIEVLDDMLHEGTSETKAVAYDTLLKLQSFSFAFMLNLMIKVLAITNELSIALQRKDQDIVNAIQLVRVAKLRLQGMRDQEWELLFHDAVLFCNKENIHIPSMNDVFVLPGRSRRNSQHVTNLHHYQVEVFYTVVDMQLQELNSRFDEVNTQLLCSLACLSPNDSFATYDKQMVLNLARFYPTEFSDVQIIFLEHQLETYIFDMQANDDFKGLKGIEELSMKMVKTKKHLVYPLVYLLLKMALILPVATASVERAFSAMTYVKNKLRNWMGDEFLCDCLISFIEKDVLDTLSNECILEYFQNMKTRRGSL